MAAIMGGDADAVNALCAKHREGYSLRNFTPDKS